MSPLPLKHVHRSYFAPALVGIEAVDGDGNPILVDIHLDSRPEKLAKHLAKALQPKARGAMKGMSGLVKITARRPPPPTAAP